MFEFGKDLRKLFAQARESDDLGWVELIGVELLKGEAARQSTDAGRVSCPRPFAAWMRTSALWREHARRTGVGSSLERASNACADATKAARRAVRGRGAGCRNRTDDLPLTRRLLYQLS